jgi:hypothetical protein
MKLYISERPSVASVVGCAPTHADVVGRQAVWGLSGSGLPLANLTGKDLRPKSAQRSIHQIQVNEAQLDGAKFAAKANGMRKSPTVTTGVDASGAPPRRKPV